MMLVKRTRREKGQITVSRRDQAHSDCGIEIAVFPDGWLDFKNGPSGVGVVFLAIVTVVGLENVTVLP